MKIYMIDLYNPETRKMDNVERKTLAQAKKVYLWAISNKFEAVILCNGKVIAQSNIAAKYEVKN